MEFIYWDQLDPSTKVNLLKRPVISTPEQIRKDTLAIIQKVKERGDDALRFYNAKFDTVWIENIAVSQSEWEKGCEAVSLEDKAIIRSAIKRIKNIAQAQLPENWSHSDNGVTCERQARAIEKVGLYVPGGTAPLVSTVLMLAVPALVAGCASRVLCTPPTKGGDISPYILFAAKECGIHQIFKVGGAQAIAALAYGTDTIQRVDKIFGPGNSWVTTAKQLCAQDNVGVSIDMPAGPSELLVIVDKTANPNFVAADLLSQAEHDICAQVILVSTDQEMASKIIQSLNKQLSTLPRQAIAQEAIKNSRVFVANSINSAIELSNQYGPEHLSLQIQDPENYCSQITSAGTVFIGTWTAEALGDYITGSNHVLPTNGYARSISGLSVNDFLKWVGFQKVTRDGLAVIGNWGRRLAAMEQLDAHERAIAIRMENNDAS